MYIHSVKILYLPLAPGYFIIFLFDPFTLAVFLSDFLNLYAYGERKKKNEYSIVIFGLTLDVGV